MEPFRKAFRGYDSVQVDRAVSDLNSQVEGLRREVELLRNQSDRLDSENAVLKASLGALEETEEAVKEALISAHKRAEEVLAGARGESEILLQVARETGVRMQEDLKGRIEDLNWQVEKLALKKQKFLDEFRTLLESYLQSLSSPQGPALFSEEVPASATSPRSEESAEASA